VFRILIVLAALAWPGAARGERAVLECIADTSIARGDRNARGSSRTLDLSNKGALVLAFRTGAVEGWRLEQVVLLLHVVKGEAPYRIRLGALAKPFSETTGTWDSIPRPKTTWRRVRTYDENWIAIDLSPEEAGGAGIVLSGAEAHFDARESVGFAPYLLVEGVSAAGKPH
jgi:hypothetical protein